MKLQNYACGEWIEGKGKEAPLYNSITGDQVALASSEGLDFSEMLGFVGRLFVLFTGMASGCGRQEPIPGRCPCRGSVVQVGVAGGV